MAYVALADCGRAEKTRPPVATAASWLLYVKATPWLLWTVEEACAEEGRGGVPCCGMPGEVRGWYSTRAGLPSSSSSLIDASITSYLPMLGSYEAAKSMLSGFCRASSTRR